MATVKLIKPSEMAEEPPEDGPRLSILIDWATFWNRDQSAEDWLVWPLLPAGRGVALYAPAKAGKSLVVLALVAGAATGRVSLDGTPRGPVDILYLDYEMTLDDLQERLEDMGYGPKDDLSHLHYASLPSLPPLDTPEGAKAVVELVEDTGAQAVVIDTLGRAVDGDENDADTVRAFYRWTGLALKAAGVAFLRTDHAGKDLGKGQRGSSAKNDDVDVVWQLIRTEGGVTLRATHRRMQWVPESVPIAVGGDEGWTFDLTQDETYPPGTKELAELLDTLGVDPEATTRVTFTALRDAGHKRRSTAIRAAIRWRKAAFPSFTDSPNLNGTHCGTHTFPRHADPVSGPTGRTPSDNSDTQDKDAGTHHRDPADPLPTVPVDGWGSHVVGPTHPAPPDDDLQAPF